MNLINQALPARRNWIMQTEDPLRDTMGTYPQDQLIFGMK
jgi:hypothetical protein